VLKVAEVFVVLSMAESLGVFVAVGVSAVLLGILVVAVAVVVMVAVAVVAEGSVRVSPSSPNQRRRVGTNWSFVRVASYLAAQTKLSYR